MSPSQKLKDEGNSHFKAARYEVAIDYYTKYRILTTFLSDVFLTFSFLFSFRALACASDGEEKSVLHTNRATCYAQLHQFTEVSTDRDSTLGGIKFGLD